MNKNNDSINGLVRHAAGIGVDDIPDDVMQWSAVLFQDTVACILAGSTADGIGAIRESLLEWGGNPQATVLGFGDKTSAPSAAFINAVMGHARDFDDTHDAAIHHGCVTIVPALLAVAEQVGTTSRRVSGREFIAALAVGLDVANRIGLAFIPYLHTGWLPTTLWGPFGCVAACGRLLGFDADTMANAFGLAYSAIHGNRQALVEGRLAKRMQPGISAQAGVQAACLAARGLTGATSIIDGDFGIPALYTSGKCDRKWLTEDLGTLFETSNVSIKPYPSCRCTHAVIDAAMSLQKEHAFSGQDVDEGTIYLPPQAMGQVGHPFEIRDNPTVDAQFCAPYTAALTLINGKVGLDDFRPEAIRDRDDVVALAAKFSCVEFEKDASGLVPIVFSITLKDGRRVETRVESPKGSPSHALTEQEMATKFNDCLDHAVRTYSEGERAEMLSRLRGVLTSDPLNLEL